MSPDADEAFTAIAAQLYAAPAGGFVAARNARARLARADGDRDLAARITALPKPSAAAALVNLLVRDGGDDLTRVLALGGTLRAAQRVADREALRRLGVDRRDLLAEVTRNAVARAERDGGHAPGAAVLDALQQTLQAALVDEDAAAAVTSGRLIRALAADGLDPVDLAGAIGGPERVAARPARTPSTTAADDRPDAAGAERARQRQDAEQRATETGRHADRADRDAAAAADRAREADEEVARRGRAAAQVRDRLDELRADLAAAEGRVAAAEEAAAGARDTARQAVQDAEAARDEAEDAAKHLRDLTGRTSAT